MIPSIQYLLFFKIIIHVYIALPNNLITLQSMRNLKSLVFFSVSWRPFYWHETLTSNTLYSRSLASPNKKRKTSISVSKLTYVCLPFFNVSCFYECSQRESNPQLVLRSSSHYRKSMFFLVNISQATT